VELACEWTLLKSALDAGDMSSACDRTSLCTLEKSGRLSGSLIVASALR
jgi:hypothetical protein